MTREEAVEKLEAFTPMVVDDTREALDMAIEALQAEPVKHGKWCFENSLACPVCGYLFRKPNCGAKMDGERREP